MVLTCSAAQCVSEADLFVRKLYPAPFDSFRPCGVRLGMNTPDFDPGPQRLGSRCDSAYQSGSAYLTEYDV